MSVEKNIGVTRIEDSALRENTWKDVSNIYKFLAALPSSMEGDEYSLQKLSARGLKFTILDVQALQSYTQITRPPLSDQEEMHSSRQEGTWKELKILLGNFLLDHQLEKNRQLTPQQLYEQAYGPHREQAPPQITKQTRRRFRGPTLPSDKKSPKH